MDLGLADAGLIASFLAFSLAIYQLAATIVGYRWSLPALLRSARNAALGNAALLLYLVLTLLVALERHDFSIAYVAEVSSRSMPWSVTVTSLWGGQPGSLLLWTCGLAVFSAVAVWRAYRDAPALAPFAGATLAAIQAFFLFLVTFVSSPFTRLPVPALDGVGLNPLLWDDGMFIHPPLLLTGFMSFSLPFAFVVAGLLAGRLDRAWLARVRRWALVAWGIQGAGLLAGMWWAYHVLGWGGYWGWDPVENAALLPWLCATAFLHSVQVQERRGMLKAWNVALIVAAFALSIFGTFIVRSGIITSVHSFALSAVGPYFFAFLGIVLAGSLGLLLYRLPLLRSEGEFDTLLSRESSFLVNNLLLVGIAAATFWGTVFPALSEALRGARVAVGAPFYQQVNGPLLLVVLLLMGLGPLLAWRRTSPGRLWRLLRWPLATWAGVSLVLLAFGLRPGLAAFAFGACAFVAVATLLELWHGAAVRRRSTHEAWPVAFWMLMARDRRRYGGYIVHLAMVLIAAGAIGQASFQQEAATTLPRGGSVAVGRYRLTFEGLFERRLPDLDIVLAHLRVQQDGREIALMEPERRTHRGWEQQPTTGVAIHTTWPWLDDLYVLLTGWQADGSATFRIIVNPLVSFIWLGALLFLAGTLIAGWPERARLARPAGRPSMAVVPARGPSLQPAAPEVVLSDA